MAKNSKEQHPEEAGPVDIPLGKIVGQRWKVIDKLGEGGCGAVYLVEHYKSHARGALKAESNFVPGGSVLKLEVQILRRMAGKKFVAQLITSGKKEKYCYMVMTLFGDSLSRLFKNCHREFSISTQVRLGMQILYGLKQLHEVGFVHRDVKPANMAIGKKGNAARVIHLLDFGLAREYIIKNEAGKVSIRKPRENTLFRGTTKYCSANTHTKAEQGRPDDLWSMIYVLAEMKGPLPWDQLRDKHEIGKQKTKTTDEQLLARSPAGMLQITAHLRELDYYKRPDYNKIFTILEAMMTENNIKHADPFDWELITAPLEQPKFRSIKRKGRIITVEEDVEVNNSKAEKVKDNMSDDFDAELPFTSTVFTENIIGF